MTSSIFPNLAGRLYPPLFDKDTLLPNQSLISVRVLAIATAVFIAAVSMASPPLFPAVVAIGGVGYLIAIIKLLAYESFIANEAADNEAIRQFLDKNTPTVSFTAANRILSNFSLTRKIISEVERLDDLSKRTVSRNDIETNLLEMAAIFSSAQIFIALINTGIEIDSELFKLLFNKNCEDREVKRDHVLNTRPEADIWFRSLGK